MQSRQFVKQNQGYNLVIIEMNNVLFEDLLNKLEDSGSPDTQSV